MTGEDQQLLASVLDDLAESPAPPSGMDTCRAIRDGRRLRLRRRLVAGGAVLALVAASVGTAAALTHHSPAPPALPAPRTGRAPPRRTTRRR
ncbi:hypothetical protein GXW82_41875 [Streptacidiphilus sp. 4-A2]|nr:hypothetical protein [Streptacidiphilus sp. 4-A2]